MWIVVKIFVFTVSYCVHHSFLMVFMCVFSIMEADICEENVSLSAANLIDVSDNIDESDVDRNSAENVTETVDDPDDKPQNNDDSLSNNEEGVSDDKPQNNDDSLSNNEDGDYYEVISADGSVGGDGIDDANDDIGNPDEQFNLTNAGLTTVPSSVVNETCSFVDLPFVPKFEFPLDPCQSENVSNYGAFRVNQFISDNIPKPDKNFTVPPPNFRPLDIKPSFDSVQGAIFSPPVHNPTFCLKDENVSTVSEKPCGEITSSSRDIAQELKNLPESSKKDAVVDWVDENGDPLPGAFDYVKPNEERDVSVENTRVEYVFSVREKKDVPVDSNEPCVLNSGFLISQNVLHKNVAGNIGVHLRLPSGPSGFAKKGLDEEKKLYEASKSGAEYKAAVQAVTASTSTTDTSVNRIVPENEVAKKDRLPRFRRNRFTDIKKEDEQDEEPSEIKPQKSAEDVALESQAVTEILKEVQRGAARAKEVGALGWQKCPIPVTNKTFLRNTLVSTLREPYRPPSKRGRFHMGLKADDDGGKLQKTREDNRSSSSRSSRSRSSSRGHSSSYSRSRSGSSYTDDDHPGSRDKHRQFSQRGRGSWNRGQHHYYDDAWAAYAAHYGYPWYGPEALPMFYGPEGWPMDPYAAMYYGDPQAWMEYEAYYGPQNFGPRGMGRGFRGRGRGGRGRGRGGYEGDFRGYNIGGQSPRAYSRSRSRSGRSRSWSRDLSRSRSRSRGGSFEMRDRSHSASQGHAERKSKRRPRSKGESGDKTASDAETSEKKKKKKKKKKKHKKLKKSKHRQKGENSKSGDKIAEESVDEITETTKISGMNDEKKKPEEKTVENYDLVKKIADAKSENRKEQTKYKSGDKDMKNYPKEIKERQFDSKVREEVLEKGDMVKSKGDNRTVDEQLGSSKNDEHAFDVREEQKQGTRKQKEKFTHYSDGDNKYKGSNSKGCMDKSKSEDLLTIKLKDKTGDSHGDGSSDKKQAQRKEDRPNDNRVNVIRDKIYVESDNRMSGQSKQDINRRRRGGSSEFKEEPRISGERYKYGEDKDGFMFDKRGGYENKDKRDTSGAKVDTRAESRERKESDVYSHGRDNSRGRLGQDSIQYKQRRGGTQGDRSESCDSGRSSDGRSSKDGHKYKLNRDVAGRNRRSESNENTSKSRMIDGRSDIHFDGKRSRIGGYKDGRSMIIGDARSIIRGDRAGIIRAGRGGIMRGDGRRESCDNREGDPKEGKQKMGRDNRGENWIIQDQERLRKVDCSYKEGTGDDLHVTKGSRKLDDSAIRQSKLGGNKYNEKDGSSDTTEREKKNSGNKERNKLVSKQRVLPMDNKEESSEKTTACLNKDIHRKRQRSTSCDKIEDSFDKIQTTRIISLVAGGNQRQRAKNKDNDSEESKKYEGRSGFEGKQSERYVKSDKNRIQSKEKQTVDTKIKESDFKKHRERIESKIQQSSEQCEETGSPENLKEKRAIKRTQVGNKSGATIDKTGSELKNQGSTRDSNEHPDITDRDGTTNKDTIENTDSRLKDDSKGVKRKKKIIKKLGAKKMKASSRGHPPGGEKLISEGDGEASKATQKQLAPEYILNKETEEMMVVKSLDATVESSK